MTSTLPRITTAREFAAAFDVSHETSARFATYETLLRQWQKTINLVASSSLDEVWHRHFADCAQIAALRPDTATRWLDLGSGAGFPGLVVALMLSEKGGIHMTLVESDRRKAAFLREVARQTGIAVDILCTRIENLPTHSKVPQTDVVSARALAPLPKLLELAAPMLAGGALGVFLKGREASTELAAAKRVWHLDADLVESRTDLNGRIVLVRSLHELGEIGS